MAVPPALAEADPLAPGAARASPIDPPFVVFRPAALASACVFASPHSGRAYPEELLTGSRLDALTLRRSEDSFVDALFASAPAQGAPLLAARFPRAYVDVNREEQELDGAMFEGGLDGVRSARVAAGLGVIPRLVRDGAEIYAGKLPAAAAEDRLARCYRPYHAALGALLSEAEAAFGCAILIDCHSMPTPSPAEAAGTLADVVIGDRYGTSAAPQIVAAVERAFSARGYRTARNAPYAGGYITERYGHPHRGRHALQIELRRSLYMDEERIAPHEGFTRLAADIAALVGELVRMPVPGTGRSRR